LTSGYPNPFSSEARFDLVLSADANVVAEVFDVAGRRVSHMDLGRLSAGSRAISFDGAGDNGRPLPSGVYFYRVTAKGTTAVKKIVIAR
jgi:flagellar hook assembly protein FlgD